MPVAPNPLPIPQGPLRDAQTAADMVGLRAERLRRRYAGTRTADDALADALGPLKLPLDEDLQRWMNGLDVRVSPELVALAQCVRLLRRIADGHEQGGSAGPVGEGTARPPGGP